MARRYEYCGVIYRDAEGIKAGLPETYGLTNYCKRPVEPPGTELQAGYHNHRETEWFSREDRALAGEVARYLCTPSGHVLKMTSEGTVIVR